jgi:hypothetical protein
MKVFTYTLSTIGLSLLMAVLANPGVAAACTRILGNS